jgi:AraC-like DNA-binding protein
MKRKNKDIPENAFSTGSREGIFIARKSSNGPPEVKEVGRSHRDNGHLFILQERGATLIEVDFQIYHVSANSVLYIHPSQVHRLVRFEDATVGCWIITNENLRPEYLNILETLTPVDNLELDTRTMAVISDTVSLCIEFTQRKQERLFESILRESCNTLVALVASQFLVRSKTTDNTSRFELITRSFKTSLEHHFLTVKSPSAFAGLLNVSTPYLNECVKYTTGHSVSYHIQQRVVLEAKRLLYHSGKSVKEIAGSLGYDDYAYFTRLFVKLTGMTPVSFRNKNLDLS